MRKKKEDKSIVLETQDQAEAVAKYAGLSNEQLIMIYFRFKSYADKIDSELGENKASKTIDTPMGTVTTKMDLPDGYVEEFKAGVFYKTVHSVIEVLAPIVEILQECDPELKKIADEFR